MQPTVLLIDTLLLLAPLLFCHPYRFLRQLLSGQWLKPLSKPRVALVSIGLLLVSLSERSRNRTGCQGGPVHLVQVLH
jgi:hypothetical protein